jgi:hypothetical protein
VSQELTDAEWLKELAEWFRRYGALEGVAADQAERDVARLRSIAAKLERPAVDTDALVAALKPFAELCPGGFEGVGLGTRVSPSITVGMIQAARDAMNTIHPV